MRDVILTLFEIAGGVATAAGLYILLGLGPTLLVSGLVTLVVCLLAELPSKKPTEQTER